MKQNDMLLIGGGILAFILIQKHGGIGTLAGKLGISLPTSLTGAAPPVGAAGINLMPSSGTTTYAPSNPAVIALAKSLGTTAYRVATALNKTGKTSATLTLADLAGVPTVPSVVMVNGVPSYPVAGGVPATFSNPTGSSGTWGGLSGSQIQASFIASYGANAQAEWQKQHDAAVLLNGF